MTYKIIIIFTMILLTACEPPAAPTFVVPIPTNPTTNTPQPTPTDTPEPTYTTLASPTKVVPSATPTRLPPLPTLDPSATAPAVFFLQVDVPAGVGWGWVAGICGLSFNEWPIVDAFNSSDGKLHSGVQSIACPNYRKD